MDEVRSEVARTGRLAAIALERLDRPLSAALRRARRHGAGQLVSVTVEIPGEADPTAVAISSRYPDEPWFCFEQPDRGGAAVAALGRVRSLEASGPGRFATVSRQWQELSGRAVNDAPSGVPGSGLIAVGGFAFAPTGGASPRWRGFPAAALTVPEVSLARRDGEAWLTLNLDCAPDDTMPELLARAERRLLSLRSRALPLLDPAPSGRYEVASVMPPAHYEQAVARGVQRIRAGELEKVVLAREVEVHAPRPHDAAAMLGLLRGAFQSCYVFAVGRGDATFVAASPELLIRREGQRASTVALAGSIRRSADPAVDDHLGEQLLSSVKDREENAIVARRIATRLRPHSVWVSAADEPGLVRVANIQHLGAPIRAQLRSPIDAVSLAGVLHPTPAVGGEPDRLALELIPALEGMDRGWYAGPVGWTDSMGDGEFCVALRCALLRGALATCYAGAGIVRDSDPAAELAETEVKLQALLPLLAG
ncbi:MAG: menaquinone-specific isochorismate synthase [Solirubrobacteraceae bacterium]|jgi:salicylate biosynthesis isochorismate synthase/menaquinone-specific isochorismate synthase|nr:menaquinone-specific isochorismate synthase [Solirubrobacteraceae bacterium]